MTGPIPPLQVSDDLAATAINPGVNGLALGFAAGVPAVGLATTQSMGSMRNAALRPACGWSR